VDEAVADPAAATLVVAAAEVPVTVLLVEVATLSTVVDDVMLVDDEMLDDVVATDDVEETGVLDTVEETGKLPMR
jgi:hypothetical protein